MKERVKQRIRREVGKAKVKGTQAITSLRKGRFKAALSQAGKAAGHVKQGLFGQGFKKTLVSQNGTPDKKGNLQPNTRNTRVVIGGKDNKNITMVSGRARLQDMPKPRNRSEAARKAAITRRMKGGAKGPVKTGKR